MSSLKVLVLVQHDCVPPAGATNELADWAHWKTEHYVQRALSRLGHRPVMTPVSDDLQELQQDLLKERPDVVFNLLEEYQGRPHYESHIAAFLELMGVPYTGCNPLGLSLGRDKALSKRLLQSLNIPTPDFFTVPKGRQGLKPACMHYPLIVKSLNEEASLGISQQSVVRSDKTLAERVQFIHQKIQTPALVEEYVEGREIYMGVLGHQSLKVLPPWELSFGDLASKGYPIATRTVKFSKTYEERHHIQRGPAKDLTPHSLKKLQTLSREIYRGLSLSGYARLDYRMTDSEEIYFLEANPNPELAKGECFANGAKAAGLSYDQLINKIIHLACRYQQAA
jgi:D-alanine-D-alanine ligase